MLPFTPRKVARTLKAKEAGSSSSSAAAKEPAGKIPIPTQSTEQGAEPPLDNTPRSSTSKGKRKAQEDSQWLAEEDYAVMLRLTMTKAAARNYILVAAGITNCLPLVD